MRVSPGIVFPRTHIPRDACFPAHIYITNELCSTSHSDTCFPGYYVSPSPLRMKIIRLASYIAIRIYSYDMHACMPILCIAIAI